MSPTPSTSAKNLLLPLSDQPHGSEQRDRFLKLDEKLFKGSAMTKRGAYAALSYMSCAVLLVMFNKAALSSYNFPSANVITLFQMICSTCFLYILRRWKLISFVASEPLTISDNSSKFVSLKTLKGTLPLAGAYLLYMLATMEAVRGVNVPMYTTLRRTTVVFTMVVERVLSGQKYTSPVVGRFLCLCWYIYNKVSATGFKDIILIVEKFDVFMATVFSISLSVVVISVGMIVFGAIIAGARDLSFDYYGYALVFLSNATTAVYLATIARVGKSSGLNSFGLMWCNGVVCGPVLLVGTYFWGDLDKTISFPYLFSPGFVMVMLCSCMLAFFLNYSIFLNTTLNSALTQTICGNLKDFFTIGLGWMIFGGLPFDWLNVIGQLLGFLGSGMYAYYKLMGK